MGLVGGGGGERMRRMRTRGAPAVHCSHDLLPAAGRKEEEEDQAQLHANLPVLGEEGGVPRIFLVPCMISICFTLEATNCSPGCFVRRLGMALGDKVLFLSYNIGCCTISYSDEITYER